MSKEQEGAGFLAWAFRDSTTGKASSTKIIQVVVALGIVALCIVWAVQGQLTFEAGRDFVLYFFGIQTTGNVGTRGIKAYAAKATPQSSDDVGV